MEWYFSNAVEDLVVPKDYEQQEMITSPESWSQMGMNGFGGSSFPKKNFNSNVNMTREELTFNGGKNFYTSINMTDSNNEVSKSNNSSMSQELYSNGGSLLWNDQADFQQFTDEEARINHMDDVFFSSLLEEEDPTKDSTETHGNAYLDNNASIFEDEMVNSHNIGSRGQSIGSSKYLKTHAFSPSTDWVNREASTTCQMPKNTSYENTMEESVLNDLERVTAQFTDKTRICFRDALYRLAESSKQSLSSCQDGESMMTSNDDTIMAGETEDSESKTNVIDRAVANLMFHKFEFEDSEDQQQQGQHQRDYNDDAEIADICRPQVKPTFWHWGGLAPSGDVMCIVRVSSKFTWCKKGILEDSNNSFFGSSEPASAMANTTPLVTTVTKPAINLVEANSTPRVNIQEFCEEHYEDILPIIMEKVRHDRRKDVHTRLDFEEGPRERIREDSYYSNTRARATEPGRVKVQDRLKYGSRHVLDRLGHRRQSAFDQLSETYSPSTTKSRPQRTDPKDSPRGRICTRPLSASRDGHHKDRECLRSTRESKKKGHVSWKPQDQSKRHSSDKRSDFRSHPKEGRGPNRFTPLTRTPKEILATEASKFQPPPPMVTPVEKRSSNKFCDFHNDKGHSTDECTQLKKQIEELVRAEKLSHLIKEIKQGRDQSKTGKKETAAKDKPTAIYMMVPATTSMTGFSNETIWTLGQLRFLAIIGDTNHSTKAWMNFMVVKSMLPYNGIIGRPGLKAIQAVLSTVHGMLKFPVEGGIATIRSTILIPTECASVTTSSVIPREERTCPANFTVALHPDFPDQEVVIGGSLSDKGCTELCSVLKKKLDIFTWQPSNMTGVPRSVAEHRLNIREGYSPVRQKKKGQAPERARAIQAEVQKLVDAGIMREVYYHDWLYNPVMVKKHDGCWRMCVDFTDLNKACPQDCYPFPKIDWKVESLCGYPFKCFLDAYKGYHQIQLAELDDEKTAFHTGQGVYVDDLVVKSHTEAERMRDIEETFRTLRRVNMKLNPKKCSFGLAEGVFLGYVITLDGIKPCPDKTAAVLQLPSPRTVKESDFRWTAEAKQAFQQLKQHLSELPLLVAPKPQEELIMYLSATYGAVSAQKDSDGICRLILSRSLLTNSSSRPRTSVKGQILADFLIEMSGDISQAAPAAVTQEEPWTLFTNGSSSSNNEAEYEAMVAGLQIAAQIGVKNVQVNVDSKLVANQVLGTYVAKEGNMIKYLEIVKGLVSGFTTFSISQVPRSKNKKADALSKIASTSFAHLSKQVVEVLENKSIKEKEVATVIEEDGPT
nr:reverse transcriptase domain-containing protein [Tanacetum cinerariifolium]